MSIFKLPRFQFFYSLRSLGRSLFFLFFIDANRITRTNHFLQNMQNYFGRKHSHLVSSYRMGLYFTLKSLNLNQGDEVLLSPITVADTVNAIRLAGLKPVFIDMDLQTHCMSVNAIPPAITARSKVLLVTYLSGIVPEVDQYRKICEQHHLYLIEDISQNIGACYKNQRIGSHGDISIASLSCGKNISTLYGGLILSDDLNLVKKIKFESEKFHSNSNKWVLFYYLINCLKVQIATSRYVFSFFVYPFLKVISVITKQYPPDFNHDPSKPVNIFRSQNIFFRDYFPKEFFVSVNNWQIKIALNQIPHLDKGLFKRKKLAQTLIDHLSEKSLLFTPSFLKKIEENSYYHFPIYCNEHKNKLRQYLFKNGVDTGSYGLNLCTQEMFSENNHLFPNANTIKHDSLFLPLHEKQSENEMKKIAILVNDFFDAN